MKRMIYGAALLLAAISTGCDKNESGNPGGDSGTPTPPEERRITFTTAIAATRAPAVGGGRQRVVHPGRHLHALCPRRRAGRRNHRLQHRHHGALLARSDLRLPRAGRSILEACYPKQTLRTEALTSRRRRMRRATCLGFGRGRERRIGEARIADLPSCHAPAGGQVYGRGPVDRRLADRDALHGLCNGPRRAVRRPDPAERLEADLHRNGAARSASQLLPQSAEEVTLEIHAGSVSRTWKLTETDFSYPELEGRQAGDGQPDNRRRDDPHRRDFDRRLG